MKKIEFLSFLFIFLISAISVFDLFHNIGRPATFDAPTHITDIAGYSLALLSHDFPVFWLDSFGNYGMPVGFFSHQLPLTLAGGTNIFFHNPLLIFYIFFFFGIFLTNTTFYVFLRLYFSTLPSLLGIVLLTLAPYRITNIYIRGDMPETFSGIFLGLILFGMHGFFSRNKIWGFFLITISYFCLSITHPMMLLTYGFFIFPYLIFLLLQNRNSIIKKIFIFFFAVFIGVGMASYFILPLTLETKYLYFGQEKNHLSPQFLSWKNFFGENWFYYYRTDIFPRGQFIQIGLIECLVFLTGVFSFVKNFIQKKWKSISIQAVAILSGIATLFMTTMLALPFYQHFAFLTTIQFPWRMLSVFIFLSPIIAASLFEKVRNAFFIILAIVIVCLIRFPQLYGKNYTNYPVQSYYFTPYNLFPILMNTIWTGKTEDYPIEAQKVGIIHGNGTIISQDVHNSSRKYIVNAITPLRLVDYTFYFPGWHVFIDGAPVTIEFQDPSYRGVITYMVPQGGHTIQVVLEDTGIRRIGKLLSLLFIGFFVLFGLFKSRLSKLLLVK